MSIDVMQSAQGRWVEILSAIGGVPISCLDNKHKPCPSCGEGRDRFRFDDIDGNGTWFCNQCGGKDHAGGAGNGMDLLMRIKKWSFKTAASAVEQHLGIRPAPPISRGRQYWRYSDDFYVVRKDKPDGGKDFLPLWFDGTEWKWAAPPAPRPLYNLDSLSQRPDAPVLIVEGEKTADAAAKLFPSAIAITWPSGCKAINKADWLQLIGRNCTLWPDSDAPGIQAMDKLQAKLLKLGADQVRIVTPPPDVPEGWDLADAEWTIDEAGAYLKANRSKPLAVAVEPAIQLVEIEPSEHHERKKPSGYLPGMPFRCLGFDRGIYFYLPDKACQVVSLTPAQHIKNYLITLAPLDVWANAYGKENEKGQIFIDWTGAADALISTSIKAGVYDPSRIRGRGTWFDDSRVILHLGNRLVIDGASSQITQLPENLNSYYFYENAKSIQGPGNEALGDAEAQELANIAQGFRWETPASANLLLGWIVLAPVCGALDWRPHIWVTGPAGSGKTSLLKLFMKPLLGGMFEGATGGTTEAGLRGQLRSDAIPIVFDELEQNEQKDKQQVQNILSLARIASSEGGKIYKGTTSGGVNTFEIRSMFCVSSINVGLVQRADLDRFCVLSLRKDQISKDDWVGFEARILESCIDDNGRKLVARTILQIPLIRRNSRIIASALAIKFGQRYGDQYGTLLAGAWTLKPNGGGEITVQQALAWIDSMNWENREVDTNDADEVRCVQKILQTILQLDGGRRITVFELVQFSASGKTYVNNHSTAPEDEIESILGRYGMKVMEGCLAVANSSTNLQSLLRDTPWAGNAYRQSLRRLPEAVIAQSPIRFKGMGPSRATLIPLHVLEIL
jgi:putative DNA primase/helicase